MKKIEKLQSIIFIMMILTFMGTTYSLFSCILYAIDKQTSIIYASMTLIGTIILAILLSLVIIINDKKGH